MTELTGLGLTLYEAKTYLALVRRESSTAPEASRLAGVPRQRIYDVLETLNEKGLVGIRPGRVARFAAAAPDQAVERLLARRRLQLTASEDAAARLVEALHATYERRQRSRQASIELLHGPNAMAERLRALGAAAKREFLAFAKPPYAQILADAPIRPGCRRRSLHELADLEGRSPDAAAFFQQGEQARFVRELPHPLVVVDRAIAAYSFREAPDSELTTMMVADTALVQTYKLAFEAAWEPALTLEQARERLRKPRPHVSVPARPAP